MSFLVSRNLLLGAKGRLYSTFLSSVVLYGGESMTIKEENIIRLERNYLRLVKWMCGNGPMDIVSPESMRECLQDKRIQWIGHPERMEECAWSNKYRTFKVGGGNHK